MVYPGCFMYLKSMCILLFLDVMSFRYLLDCPKIVQFSTPCYRKPKHLSSPILSHLRPFDALFIFYLDDLSIDLHRMLKPTAIITVLSVSPLCLLVFAFIFRCSYIRDTC